MVAADGDRSQRFKVRGAELAIEQGEVADLQPGDQPGQGDLRRVGHPGEHRFPEKRPAQLDAIEAADQPPVVPAFDRMGVADRVEAERGPLDHLIDPGFVAVGTSQQDVMEGAVPGHRELSRADFLGE